MIETQESSDEKINHQIISSSEKDPTSVDRR